ncbi:hypothetical protein THASP1DRAFT_31694 [Thamnocephalis sphaerospora]|uniref:Rieske domain-containing protein n=1 Tax=Thamnocephalis sphaerospora TaxID=78915 RepID=A0A4V1IW66_9FUNG|nr:hypothetical protein THASP1DRAFT_31694 [Thamnocephalis sphaerospora]|eukprot:RKP06489.1 hypothetical protein THASP1DRAFT_31694 [Thamnocephalis sphaerospora]
MSTLHTHVANVDDLEDGQMTEVEIGNAKVLLSRVAGTYFATSALCTHYKAPLVKGVLSADGRVTCPWHGSCFSVCTGDLEDTPGLDALIRFKVTIDGEKVIVSANPEDLDKVGRAPPVCAVPKDANAPLALIVGGGAGGISAAESMRESGFTGRVLIVSSEPYLPIDRPKLSKDATVDASKAALRSADELRQAGIDIRLSTTVQKVDPSTHTVTLTTGEVLNYAHLVLAVGGKPQRLPNIPEDMNNVFLLRSAENATAIYSGKKPQVVIIGSSFIGMEIASVLSQQANITVVAIEKEPFQRVLGERIGAAVRRLHEQNGVSFVMEAMVDGILRSPTDAASAAAIQLKSGQQLPADVVVVGAGVRPATEFLRDTFTLEKDGSLVVDAHMRVCGTDNVYAVGDIATFPCCFKDGAPIRVEHWSVGLNTGRCAGKNIAGQDAPYKTVPYFWTAMFGKSLRYCGHSVDYDDVIIQGDLDALAFAAFYVHGNQVQAVASLNKDPTVSQASELFRLGRMPSADKIRDGLDILTVNL